MRTCISRILERLFCQPHVLVGISVMDVLNVLVTFLIESVAGKRIVVPDSSVFSAVLKAMLAGNEFDIGREFETSNIPSDYYYLLAAIGGLARHHYYSNQVADMIEYLVQRMQLPAISLYINSTDEKAAKEAASASVNNVANTDGEDIAFFQKALGPASIMDMLGADVAAQYEELRSKQGSTGEGYWESDSESVDRMLCNPGEDSAPAREMQNSVSQVNDIRARVSVDWETQMRRDSILAPHVNIDQLRMALHDGLSVHSSEHLASISVNENRARIVPRSNISESSVYYPYGSVVDAGTARGTSKKAVPNDDYSGEEDLDMYGRPLPEDVRDLLDSIDNDDYDNGGIIIARPPPKRSDGRILDEDIATHGSPTISTPVVGNVE
ncbi:hypothetical protein LPJ72_001057 [Coemansia sp. Benny D160-2]|nr:hypothetical protein LPJ72_001057 [Coemansia sp. Benny D160-2]